MSNTMTTTSLSPRALAYYFRALLETSRPLMAYAKFGTKKPMKEHMGKTINFARFEDLPAAVTPLSEGITPAGRSLIEREITATLQQYGDFVSISDVVDLLNFDPALTIASEKLGHQQGLTLDTVLRDALMQGTNEIYANGKTARTSVADKLQKIDIQKISRFLQSNNVRPITARIDPSTGIATEPVPAAYIAIGHTDLSLDLDALDGNGFTPVHKYANPGKAFEGEYGTLAGVRFILTSNAPILAAAGDTPSTGILASGANKTDVYQTIIFGDEAFAEVPLNRASSDIIIKAKSRGDTADTGDPLNQRNTVGWKTMWAGLILDDSRIVRYEHGVTA